MFSLIKNEVFKIFHGRRLYVFLGILVFLFLIPLIEKVTGVLEDAALSGQNLSLTMLPFLSTNIITVFIIVMTAGMVTDEYINGTLKLSLLHPVSRVKLITAKIGALAVAILVFLGFTLVTGYIIGTLLFGWGDGFVFNDMIYTTKEGIIFTLSAYLVSLLPSLAFGALVMLIAMQFSSSGAAVGVLLGLVIGMSIAGELLPVLQSYLIVYQFTFFQTVLFDGELSQIILGIAVMAVYGLGSYLTSLHLFRKKDLIY